MAESKVPGWLPPFWVAQGFLLALALGITLPRWGSQLCDVLFILSASWLTYYRRRNAHERRKLGQSVSK